MRLTREQYKILNYNPTHSNDIVAFSFIMADTAPGPPTSPAHVVCKITRPVVAKHHTNRKSCANFLIIPTCIAGLCLSKAHGRTNEDVKQNIQLSRATGEANYLGLSGNSIVIDLKEVSKCLESKSLAVLTKKSSFVREMS